MLLKNSSEIENVFRVFVEMKSIIKRTTLQVTQIGPA